MILIVLLALEGSKRRKETFQRIYSWLKQKSKNIRYEEGGFFSRPRIIAELKPEMQLERVEVTTFTIHHGYYSGTHYTSYSTTYLRIFGMSEEGTNVNITIRDEGFFDKLAIGLGLTEDIVSGDPIFDRAHRVKSGTPEIALKLIKDRRFRDYVLAIRDLRKFEIRGGKHLHFVVECNFDTSSAVNAILAMERATEILAPEIRTRPIIVEKVKPAALKVEHKRVMSPELLLNLKREFKKLSMYVSKLKFEPSEEEFTRVIVTPLLEEIDYIQYNIGEKLSVDALDSLEKTVKRPVAIEIHPKEELSLSQRETTFEEIKSLFDIKCEDAGILKKVSEAYILLEYISKIRKLRIFSITLHDTTLKIHVECDMDPENVGKVYEAIKEAAWWAKFYLLI
ncbi:MAG: hypothetical protein ACTSYM_04235 [Candidatus Baldrarchaeia archaeon]